MASSTNSSNAATKQPLTSPTVLMNGEMLNGVDDGFSIQTKDKAGGRLVQQRLQQFNGESHDSHDSPHCITNNCPPPKTR